MAESTDQAAINAELLECARYGEYDDLKLLLEQHHADVNFVDTFSGNTALHRAAANGEISCIKILKEHNALNTANLNGNYPERKCHYALDYPLKYYSLR